MLLIVALGNPGTQYHSTRHNFGFLLLDKIIEDYRLIFHAKKFKSEIFTGKIGHHQVIAIKPQTFMNLSGESVVQVANFFKITPKDILVLHDDVDFDLGKIKVKVGGGAAGHNGLSSINQTVGDQYTRLRLGIGRPENKDYPVADYVLGKFRVEEMKRVDDINYRISALFPDLLDGKTDQFLNRFYVNSNSTKG